MSDIDINTITELLKVVLPMATTIITFIHTLRVSKKHAAKQSILQMIMEDQTGWEMFRKFPVNYGSICDEYEIYHKNGGNGEVTKKVNEYKDWYILNESEMKRMREYNCRPVIKLECDRIQNKKGDINELPLAYDKN